MGAQHNFTTAHNNLTVGTIQLNSRTTYNLTNGGAIHFFYRNYTVVGRNKVHSITVFIMQYNFMIVVS